MSKRDDTPGPYDGRAGPAEVHDPIIRQELKRASAWAMVAVAAILVWQLAQPILLIVAGLVFAALLDLGTRALGRVLPIARGWRLLITVLLIVAGLAGTIFIAGLEIAAQAGELRETLTLQFALLLDWLNDFGLTPEGIDLNDLLRQVLGSVGSLTSAIGSALGGVATIFLIMVIGLFVAIDPNIYDRGIQWMLPKGSRPEFRKTTTRMLKTLQRLLAGRILGMVVEGFLTWLLLSIAGVPMALLLGIIAGLLAFIPNVGAFITGVLMVAVGLSDSPESGMWAFVIYLVVQTFDGYVVVPMVAQQTVDLPPALTLSTQILFAALFGIVGLALADPIVAMAKAALERRSEHNDEEEDEARRTEAEGGFVTDPG
ncbi:AI-2E family transporter [Parasphingopyxis marina]|uniref:AI-2E family transporter n=1 Tax=Parasphingopyxis marina TaxID=2761622 RepID=A0A842I2U5_9SPHN|nr:AI-2E family transporter [Parasphingopyxis marina]MBC2779089.1 AI-2E family transporter [Parasphingopyxis marina]